LQSPRSTMAGSHIINVLCWDFHAVNFFFALVRSNSI
jgi:hypothetical protein